VSLLAFLKSNIVCIRILEDALVRSPVLDIGIIGSSAEDLLLSQQLLVVESVERETLVLVWSGWIVDDLIAVVMVPSVPVVPILPVFGVDHVGEYLRSLALSFHLGKSFDVLALSIKSIGQNKSSVSILLSTFKDDLVLIRLEVRHSRVLIYS